MKSLLDRPKVTMLSLLLLSLSLLNLIGLEGDNVRKFRVGINTARIAGRSQ